MLITAAGSLPGTDFRGALTAMAEALPEVLPLPELPARGVGSDMIGRALGLVSGLGFDLQPAGWRLVPNPGADHRRAVAQCRRELAQALVEGVAGLRAEVSRRVPGATLWVQIDEPSLLAVAEVRVPTASGFSRHRRVDMPGLVEALRPLADGSWLHCCAPGRWVDVARRAGFAGVSVDAALVDLDELAQWRDEGRALILGVVDTARGPQTVDDLVRASLRVLRAIQVDSLEGVLLGRVCTCMRVSSARRAACRAGVGKM